MTGKLLRSSMFASVFVQPASHDAGCALGSALIAHQTCAPNVPIQRSPHVYWGTDARTGPDLEKRVRMWSELITFSQTNDASGEAARLLAGEAILGWVQGKSEFGPQALGNRSILADARPASNKDVINRAIKMREWYRPFAPAVLEEFADDYFEMPSNSCAGYMTFVVPVRMCRRELLGAVTHVDGTARKQYQEPPICHFGN
jgi:carbamoyltransferase